LVKYLSFTNPSCIFAHHRFFFLTFLVLHLSRCRAAATNINVVVHPLMVLSAPDLPELWLPPLPSPSLSKAATIGSTCRAPQSSDFFEPFWFDILVACATQPLLWLLEFRGKRWCSSLGRRPNLIASPVKHRIGEFLCFSPNLCDQGKRRARSLGDWFPSLRGTASPTT
jgi:hypothetical protein